MGKNLGILTHWRISKELFWQTEPIFEDIWVSSSEINLSILFLKKRGK
jgi:hypothetical protein